MHYLCQSPCFRHSYKNQTAPTLSLSQFNVFERMDGVCRIRTFPNLPPYGLRQQMRICAHELAFCSPMKGMAVAVIPDSEHPVRMEFIVQNISRTDADIVRRMFASNEEYDAPEKRQQVYLHVQIERIVPQADASEKASVTQVCGVG